MDRAHHDLGGSVGMLPKESSVLHVCLGQFWCILRVFYMYMDKRQYSKEKINISAGSFIVLTTMVNFRGLCHLQLSMYVYTNDRNKEDVQGFDGSIIYWHIKG